MTDNDVRRRSKAGEGKEGTIARRATSAVEVARSPLRWMKSCEAVFGLRMMRLADKQSLQKFEECSRIARRELWRTFWCGRVPRPPANNTPAYIPLSSRVSSEPPNGTDRRIPSTHHHHAVFGSHKKGLKLEYAKPWKFRNRPSVEGRQEG